MGFPSISLRTAFMWLKKKCPKREHLLSLKITPVKCEEYQLDRIVFLGSAFIPVKMHSVCVLVQF